MSPFLSITKILIQISRGIFFDANIETTTTAPVTSGGRKVQSFRGNTKLRRFWTPSGEWGGFSLVVAGMRVSAWIVVTVPDAATTIIWWGSRSRAKMLLKREGSYAQLYYELGFLFIEGLTHSNNSLFLTQGTSQNFVCFIPPHPYCLTLICLLDIARALYYRICISFSHSSWIFSRGLNPRDGRASKVRAWT